MPSLSIDVKKELKGLILPLTVGKIIAAVIIGVGLYVTALRFTQGLGAVTNLSDQTPWGL
ncbi:MAG: hypothetical protein FJ279_17390 [Planctomycetes bacterium]|nr:hypothetical protein [Planctomycetota bacterium]